MRDKTKHPTYRREPRTTQERRANGKRSEWGRGRRNQSNLVDAYSDRPVTIQKTWKVKRRHQYRERSRGQQHTIFLPNGSGPSWRFWINIWELEQWFNNHDIPCCVEKVEKIETRIETHRREYRAIGWESYTYVRPVRPRKKGAKKTLTRYETKTSWRNVCGWVKIKLPKPRVSHWSTLIGYNVTWWSGKDIGIERVLQRSVR